MLLCKQRDVSESVKAICADRNEFLHRKLEAALGKLAFFQFTPESRASGLVWSPTLPINCHRSGRALPCHYSAMPGALVV